MDIYYLYGSRIQTPSTVNNAQVELGDTNNDGVIDIMDAGDVQSGLIWDANDDGIIDILDAAEILANGGIPNTPPPPPVINPNPFTGSNPTICPPGEELKFTPIGNGITITGCSSIPSQPPIDGIAPVDGYSCKAPKVLGFGIDYETGYPRYEGCVCPDASVNIADVILTLGSGYLAWRKGLADNLRRQIARAEDLLEKNYEKLQDINHIIDNMYDYQKHQTDLINELKRKVANGDNNLDWNGKPKEFCLSPGICAPGRTYEDLIKDMEYQLEKYMNGDPTSTTGKNGVVYQEKTRDLLIDTINRDRGILQGLIDSLNALLNAADPAALATAYLARLIPINFVVPKECGAFSRLNENCDCVPISSGSYSPTSLNLQIPQGYNIIENL